LRQHTVENISRRQRYAQLVTKVTQNTTVQTQTLSEMHLCVKNEEQCIIRCKRESLTQSNKTLQKYAYTHLVYTTEQWWI